MGLNKHYLYRWVDVNGKVIYVGETRRKLDRRISEHMSCNKKHTNFKKKDIKLIHKIDYMVFEDDDYGAMEHERYYISLWKPRLNKAEKLSGCKFDEGKRTDWKNYRTLDHNYIRTHGADGVSHKLSTREKLVFYSIVAAVVGFVILR